MENDNFKEGFVRQCIARGLNADQTEDLCKVAAYANAFNNKDFRKAYDSAVTEEAKSANLSMSAKAALVKKAIEKTYK